MLKLSRLDDTFFRAVEMELSVQLATEVHKSLLPLPVCSTESLGSIHTNGALYASKRTDAKVENGEENEDGNEDSNDKSRRK